MDEVHVWERQVIGLGAGARDQYVCLICFEHLTLPAGSPWPD